MKTGHRLLFCLVLLLAGINKVNSQTTFVYYEASKFLIIGRAFKDANIYKPLPLQYGNVI
jgi:hypothetical protein